MSTRFAQIFWGLLLVILDVNINHIDILPDFIGYILIAVGCSGLASNSRHFATASRLSWVLVAFALLGYTVRGGATIVLGIVNLAVDCAMIWFLFGEVMELAVARQHADLFERAANRRIAYVVVMSLTTLAGSVAKGPRDAAAALVVVLLICILPLLFLILHLIYRAKHELTSDHDA